jgi:guanosine-3',5'-bis(diphosphate) 3'-pyrophosphohydrolase
MNTGSNAPDLRLFIRALQFAARKHRDQRRKDVESSPYINHPIVVASILAVEAGIEDTELLCAALLHDTVEDTDTTEQELIDAFGEKIASIVMAVSDDKSLEKEDRKRLQIEHARYLPPAASLVKVADKIANLRDVADAPPHDWPLERRQAYFDWAKAVVDAIPAVPPELLTLFAAAYARKPEPSVAEIAKAFGFVEQTTAGVGFIIGGVRPPNVKR